MNAVAGCQAGLTMEEPGGVPLRCWDLRCQIPHSLVSMAVMLCILAGCGPRLERSTDAKALPPVAENQPHAQQADENWPGFHGVNGTGISSGSNLPAAVGPQSMLWSVDLPPTGNSSPVIWEDSDSC